ncbi:MAG: hypothetical protein OHK005_16030 [Candidatus Methylacidiphilales bacterium]
MKPTWLAVALLVLWAAMKTPWETHLDATQTRLIHGMRPTISAEMRDQLGQGLTLAALGGFRSLAATMVWLSLYEAWSVQEWPRVRANIDLAVLLQPRDTFYWDHGAWHLAWNASIDAANNPKRGPLERMVESRRWVDAGRDLLERGIRFNPEKPILHQRLGDLYWHRLEDFNNAAEQYRVAIALPGAPEYLQRFVGYALQKAGRTREAYDYFRDLWKKRDPADLPVRWERVERELRKLEDELNLPDDQRLFPKETQREPAT